MINKHFAFLDVRDDLGVIIIHKAACSSMFCAYPYGKRREIPDGRELIAFIRDPIERFRSGYNFFRRTGYFKRKFLTYKEHVDLVLSGEENIHWIPQSELTKNVTFTPYLFEDINEIWTEYGLGELPHKNATTMDCIDNPDYRLDELKQYYSGDYVLREKAHGSIS